MKPYVSTFRGLQALLISLPIGARLLKPTDLYLLPPADAANTFSVTPILIIVGLFSLLPAFISSLKLVKALAWTAALVAVVAATIYCNKVQQSILSVPIESQHREIYRSVGTIRTEFAHNNYSDDTSDLDMLMSQGFDESDIERLWTRTSVISARNTLLFSYACFFSSLSFALGCFAQQLTLSRKS